MKRKSVLVVLAVMGTVCLVSAETPPPASKPSPHPTTQPAKVYTEWPFDATEAARRQDETAKALDVSKELALDLGNKVVMKLVLIPAGKFMMGSPKDEKWRGKDEIQHEVTLTNPFYMSIYTVTQEQYAQVIGKNPSNFNGESNPVEDVSWFNAVEFCKAVSRKTGKTVSLPTEAQWEYACRAGTATPFNTGNTIDSDEANIIGEKGGYRKKTTPVGSFRPNAWGLFDMHGNVWEWCNDWDDETYYAHSPKTDPQGPKAGKRISGFHGELVEGRVQRGGGWGSRSVSCRSAARGGREPDGSAYSGGFRVIVEIK